MGKKKKPIKHAVNLEDPTVGKSRKGRWKKDLPIHFTAVASLIFVGLKCAPYYKGNIVQLVFDLGEVNWKPFPIVITNNSAQVVAMFVFAYLVGIAVYYSTKRKTRYGVEKGAAEWGDIEAINKRLNAPYDCPPKILTQNVSLSYDAYSHLRNHNTIVVGGSGAGKTRFYVKPNLLQGNTSFIVLDPKAEILRDTYTPMIEMGYDVKILNLLDMKNSDRYNPFSYIKSETNIMSLCTNLFKATSEGDSKSSDPFWDMAAQALLMAIISLLHYEAPPEEQNFAMVGTCLRYASIANDSGASETPLDCVFRDLEERDPTHIAVKFYKDYHTGGNKTLQSIQITLAARLNKFNIDELRNLTLFDMLDLETLGDKKTILYAVIPDNDPSFNFIVSILYVQLFQILMQKADSSPGGKLKVPVHFLMDEFANVCLPTDFAKYLATIRSRGISVSIILQNMSQLKSLFEKDHESIVGNCDTFLYLGGNEQSTHEYVSKSLGKETIDVSGSSISKGSHGSASTSYNLDGRELLAPDEVRLLERNKAILLVSAERPILDEKYDIKKHPNVNLGPDGNLKNAKDLEYKPDRSEFVWTSETEIEEKDTGELWNNYFSAGVEHYEAKYLIELLANS